MNGLHPDLSKYLRRVMRRSEVALIARVNVLEREQNAQSLKLSRVRSVLQSLRESEGQPEEGLTWDGSEGRGDGD